MQMLDKEVEEGTEISRFKSGAHLINPPRRGRGGGHHRPKHRTQPSRVLTKSKSKGDIQVDLNNQVNKANGSKEDLHSPENKSKSLASRKPFKGLNPLTPNLQSGLNKGSVLDLQTHTEFQFEHSAGVQIVSADSVVFKNVSYVTFGREIYNGVHAEHDSLD